MHAWGCLSRRKGRVGACVWVSPLSPRSCSGRNGGAERRRWGGGWGWLLLEEGELRADAGLVPGGGRVKVPAAPEPERLYEAPVGLRAGACGRRGPAGRVCAPHAGSCSPSRRPPAGLAAYLTPPAGLPPYLLAHSPVGCGFPRAQRSWETVPGSLGPSDPCLRLPALGRGYGRGVLGRLLSREESAPSPPQASFRVRVKRARAAAGEGRGLAARGAPLSRCPAPRRQRPPGEDREAGAGREGGFPGGPGGARAGPGAGQGGGDLGAPVLFHRRGRGAGSPPPHQPRGPHVAADVTPAPNISHPD